MSQCDSAGRSKTYADGHLLLANTWKNKKSRVYKINTETMEIVAFFDMPDKAVHASGLAFDGTFLWAADYIANTCYKIDGEESFRKGTAVVLSSLVSV